MGLGAGAYRACRSLSMTAGSVPGPCRNLQLRPTTRSLSRRALLVRPDAISRQTKLLAAVLVPDAENASSNDGAWLAWNSR